MKASEYYHTHIQSFLHSLLTIAVCVFLATKNKAKQNSIFYVGVIQTEAQDYDCLAFLPFCMNLLSWDHISQQIYLVRIELSRN